MSLLKEMFEAGVHFGHQTKFWNPKMKPYIFGVRNRIHIINLDITVSKFEDTLKNIKQEIRNNGTVLFVGTRSQASKIIEEEANRAGMPYVNHRWLGGMLTNFETVKQSIKKFEAKKTLLEKPDNGLSKKELLDLNREVAKLQSSIGGIAGVKQLPTMLFVVDTGCHNIAILEARKLGIKVSGIVDTNNDPSFVDYVIPGNDDSAKAIQLYVSKIADTIIETQESMVQDLASQVKLEIVEEKQEVKADKVVRRIKKVEDKTGVKNIIEEEVNIQIENLAAKPETKDTEI